jgi:uncharacterized protein
MVSNLSFELRKLGRGVGIQESLDALKALKLVGVADSELVQASVQATLIKDFDPTQAVEKTQAELSRVRFEAHNQRIGKGLPYPDDREKQNVSHNANFQFGMYSPFAIESIQKSPQISRSDEIRWKYGINKFKKNILTLEGHRFKKSNLGRINIRRTLQLELKRAGDSPEVFRSLKKIAKAKVVLLCDISGSMSDSGSNILNLCCSFKRIIPRSEIFLFSTRLARITHYTNHYGPQELARHIPKLDLGFGGGTKIGQCLGQFRQAYGHLLTAKTTIVIFSDGWDVGDLSLLRHEMRELQKRTNKILWINPLLDSKEYKVETQGMKIALEYVDGLISPSSLIS